MHMTLYAIHCNEVSLKGQNRYMFEDRLILNLKSKLHASKTRFEKLEKRIMLECDADEEIVKDALAKTFGIEWFAKVHEVRKDKKAMMDFVLEELGKRGIEGKTVKVETKRGDKKLPFTSMGFSSELGAQIVEKLGAKVDLHNPGLTIYVDIMQKERAFVHFEKMKGPGGLPVGCSGKVVALLSGGIDSPVASWMLLKRGAEVVFLHVHPLASAEEAEKSKIMGLAAELAKWGGSAKTRIYLADYSEFYKKTLSMPPKYELVLFRKFIYALAQEIAKKEGALAIVSGDSLGQVASQTLENIYAVSSGLEMPVFRPLVGMDKSEIIRIAEKIGTYNISIRPYKDCCSLVAAPNPETRADADFVDKIAEKIGMREVIRKTLENAKILEI